MHRTFEVKLENPEKVNQLIKQSYNILSDLNSEYHHALCKNCICGTYGIPGYFETDENYNLNMLQSLKYIIETCIQNEYYVKNNRHPMDSVEDDPKYDGVDGIYGKGFKRPEKWPKDEDYDYFDMEFKDKEY